jgi:arylsulfatase A-like enzyme
MLRQAGYRTGVVGKWHLGLGDGNADWNKEIKPGPREAGFDYSFIIPATGDRAPCVYVENGNVVGLSPDDPIEVKYQKDNPYPETPTGETARDTLSLDCDKGHNGSIVNGISRIGYMKGGESALWVDENMADAFSDKATRFIEQSRDKPFFLYFSTHDIHVPRVPHERFAGNTDMGRRGDAIAQLDGCVGDIIGTLERLNLAQDTLIIVTSDNGPVLLDGYKDRADELLGGHKPAGPFRGGKYSAFEGGVRMPFIARWPERIQPGISDAIIGQVDLLATLAALTDQEFDPTTAADSVNILPALLGESQTGRESIVEQAKFQLSLRQGDWKYMMPGRTRDNLGPWRNVDIKEPGELYNLRDDPGETNDLASKHPEKVQELKAALERIAGDRAVL